MFFIVFHFSFQPFLQKNFSGDKTKWFVQFSEKIDLSWNKKQIEHNVSAV